MKKTLNVFYRRVLSKWEYCETIIYLDSCITDCATSTILCYHNYDNKEIQSIYNINDDRYMPCVIVVVEIIPRIILFIILQKGHGHHPLLVSLYNGILSRLPYILLFASE